MAGIRDRLSKLMSPSDDEYEYYPEEDEDTAEFHEPAPRRSSGGSGLGLGGGSSSRSSARGESRGSGQVVSFNSGAQVQMVVCKPTMFSDEIADIADELLNRRTVVLNLEGADKDNARRIVDFLSGVAYANHGKLRSIASRIFILTPYNVDLTGDDVLDELESSGIYF